MNLSQFLTILLARKRIVMLTAAGVIALVTVASLLWPKSYLGTASVLLNYKGIDPVTGLSMPGALLPGYMATQTDIITSHKVALMVVEELKLAQNPAIVAQFNDATDGRGTVQDWLADLLLKKIEVLPSRESSVLEINFRGADPQFVTAVANAFAYEYQRAAIQLKAEPMRKAADYFNQQTKLRRDALEAAQSRLSKYQQEHGIVSVDNRLDVESNRLNDLSAQLVAAQGQMMEAASRRRMVEGSNSALSPDVASNPLIQNLKVGLGAAESKLAELSQRVGKNHPQYQSARAEVEKLRADLEEQMRVVSSSVGSNAQILAQREAAVRAALQAQKEKVLELNRTRDEMNVLQKDVESEQRAYEATTQRFSQTRLEGASEQSDVAVLNPAVVPLEPVAPRLVLNVILSIFIGAVLGVAAAVLAELFDRRVRSSYDLAAALELPVLGVLDWKELGPKATRRGRLKRAVFPRRLSAN